MSPLLIGLDISDGQITSALVRIGRFPEESLSIEQDTYCTRSYEIHVETDPREIISTWIQCVDDLLRNFVSHRRENDSIAGISIGLPGPMNYRQGISFIEAPSFRRFFGLNLRLAFQSALRDLVSRFKYDYSIGTATRKRSSLATVQQKQSRKITLTPSHTPRPSVTFTFPLNAIEPIQFDRCPKKESSEFCGRYDGDADDTVIQARRDTYLHDIEEDPSEETSPVDETASKLLTLVEELIHVPLTFYNDATCFALAEANYDHNQGYERILALTLSTSFGSTFLDRGEIITDRDDVPTGGKLWHCPYDQNSIADDWFSTRGLIQIYNKLLRQEPVDDSSGTSSMTLSTDERLGSDENLSMYDASLARRAFNGEPNAIKAFQTFARLLGQFLIPYVDAFRTELIIIGGHLAQAWYLLEDELNVTLKKFSKVHVYFSLSYGKSICLGAVQQQLFRSTRKGSLRQTHDYLLPVVKQIDTSVYDIYPCHQIPIGQIGVGHRELGKKLVQLLEHDPMLLIDGFVGTDFNEYAHQLNRYYQEDARGIDRPSLLFYDSRTFLHTDSDRSREIHLTDSKSLVSPAASELDFNKDFIDPKKFHHLKTNLSYPCVIIGPGSSFVHEKCPLIYIDLPKSELHARVASKTACSYLKPTRVSKSNGLDFTPMAYEKKCLYFLDYPVFNKLKQDLLRRLNYFVDGQRPNCPTWIDGDTFRQALAHLANEPIRLRPWFESGPSGGQWLKSTCTNISKHAENYLYSHEMCAPENGLLLSDGNHRLLELSWDILYGLQANRILGNENHCRLFSSSNDFPVRFNILDTIGGENLPLQCNPGVQSMRTTFGERMTQDEAYYIVATSPSPNEADTNPSPLIYLGFHDKISPDDFYQALVASHTTGEGLHVDTYVQSIPSHVHDLFLIPNETVHACGRDQVVLAISTTPHVHTFTLYDWLGSNYDARSQLGNLEQAMRNVRFDRRGEALRCQPIRLTSEQGRYEEEHLPTHPLHVYDIQRIIIESSDGVDILRSTENRFHLCMLVEGDAIEIEFNSIDNAQQKQVRRYNYIETFLIPASISEYRLRPIVRPTSIEKQSAHSVLLVVFLKWDCEKLLE